MTINTDGNTTWLEELTPPAVFPEIKEAIETGEYKFIDFTQIKNDRIVTTAKANIGKIVLVAALLGVGLVLIMRRK